MLSSLLSSRHTRLSASVVLCGVLLLLPLMSSAQEMKSMHMASVTPTHVITMMDKIPRFANPATITSIKSGAWGNASTWDAKRVPATGDKVAIQDGQTVTYDVSSDAAIAALEVRGSLQFSTATSTHLTVGTVMVMPQGTLTIGTQTLPIPLGKTAEIVFVDTPLDLKKDPKQYGNGLIALGNVSIVGAKKDVTFERLAEEALKGSTKLILASAPTGWQTGDALLLPDSRQMPYTKGGGGKGNVPKSYYDSQAEEVSVSSIQGKVVTLKSPLLSDHKGARRADGSPEPGWLPHVGNLTRNVVLRSANKTGTRGQVMFLHLARVDIEYASLLYLGRTTAAPLDSTTFNADGSVSHIGTNQIGRYALHLHHVMGPAKGTPPLFRVIGNVIAGNLKWGIAVHDSHYGLIAKNIVYDTVGSSIVTEDGSESNNVFEDNFLVGKGRGASLLQQLSSRAGIRNQGLDTASDHSGFWFRGPRNIVRRNVVANMTSFGFNYNGYYLDLSKLPFPRYPGADTMQAGGFSLLKNENIAPLESADNEVYASTGGFWATWYAGCCTVGAYTHEGVFSRYRLWNIGTNAIEMYHVSRMSFDHWTLRNDAAVSALDEGNARVNAAVFLKNSNYENGLLTFKNFDVQGFNRGFLLPHLPEDRSPTEKNRFVLKDSILNNHVNIEEATNLTSKKVPNPDGKTTILQNITFAHTKSTGVAGQPPAPLNIWMNPVPAHEGQITTPSRTFLLGANGHNAENYQVYFEEQNPTFILPQNAAASLGCPEAKFTNAQCFKKYGLAFAGTVAPCASVDHDNCSAAKKRAAALGIKGLVFPVTGTALP